LFAKFQAVRPVFREEVDGDEEIEFEHEEQHNQTQWMALVGLQPEANIFEGLQLGQRPVDALCDWDEIREQYPNWQDMPAFIQSQKQDDITSTYSEIPLYDFSPEQQKVYELIEHHYRNLQNGHNDSEQLRLIVQGVAGNKSYATSVILLTSVYVTTLHSILHLVYRYW